MLLLDIEIPTDVTVTKTDREILFSHLNENADMFVYIDTYMDYLKEFNSRKDILSKKTNVKAIAEFLPIDVNKLHTVSIKKNSKEIIVNKDDIYVELPFAPRIFYKGKIMKGPINTRIFVNKFKIVPLYDSTGKNSIVNGLKIDDVNQIKNTVAFKNCVSYQQTFENYTEHIINLDSKKPDVFNFLTSKPVSQNPIALRYSFDIDNNLALLEDILNYGIENNMEIISTMHANANAVEKYNLGIEKLIKENARLSRLEHMCKVKFPNLFNKNSKEFIFGNFDLNAMPENYKKALLAEYFSKIKVEEKMINNKCDHIIAMNQLRNAPSLNNLKNVKQFISNEKCSICDLQVACPHEIDYYQILVEDKSITQTVAKIEQLITTKYADSNRNKIYSSFCKLCGMKILDIDMDDTINVTNTDYSLREFSEEETTIKQIALSNITFSKPVSKTALYKISDNIWEAVKDIVAQFSKNKVKPEDRKLNIVVLVISAIISVSFQSDYILLKGMKEAARDNPNIIKKKSVADAFREGLELFRSKYSKLIKDSSYSHKPESIKQLFVKAYKLIKDTVDVHDEKYIEQSSTTSQDYIGITPKTDYRIQSKEQFIKATEGLTVKSLNEMEKQIIESQTKKLLYPYSHIKYSYQRYYKLDKWSRDMTLYACQATGQMHKWDSYILKDGKEIKIKEITQPLRNVSQMRCKNCKMTTKELISSKQDASKIILNVVNENNLLESFYTVFRYRCLKKDFHEFVNDTCGICGMEFAFIKKRDKGFFLENIELLKKHNDSIDFYKNELLEKHKDFTKNIKLIKIPVPKIIISNNDLNILPENLKTQMQNLGKSEGKDQDKYTNENIPLEYSNDTFSKVLDRLRQLLIYIGILVNKPKKHRYTNNSKFSEVEGLDKIYKDILKMNMIQNAWKTLDHRYVSNCIFTILNLLEKFPKAFDFALESIIESDIIFTNYNYSEIKKTFNLSKVIEDSMKENVDDDLELFDEDEPSDDES